MKDRLKDRLAAALMGDLVMQLSQREAVRKLLADMDEVPSEELIKELLDEFEKIVGTRHLKSLASRRGIGSEPAVLKKDIPSSSTASERQAPGQSTPLTAPEPGKRQVPPERMPSREKTDKSGQGNRIESPLFSIEWESVVPEGSGSAQTPAPRQPLPLRAPFPTPLGRVKKKETEDPPVPPKGNKPYSSRVPESPEHVAADSDRVAKASGEADSLKKLLENELIRARKKSEPGEKPAPQTGLHRPGTGVSDTVDLQGIKGHSAGAPASRQETPRVPCQFTDEDLVYVHAIAEIPLSERPQATPFLLEEKGFEDRELIFALDYHGMRFYLSKIHERSMNVSKSGVMLLSKQESIRMKGMHEGILNDLRAHGTLLPAEFGMVIRGRDALLAKVDDHLPELRKAFEEVLATRWWNVTVSALDARMAQMTGPVQESRAQGRERVRASYSSTVQAKKIDIKTLERILSNQKRIAESVHEELKGLAGRADVDLIIGLGSGSSEEWKPILKASYEVPSSDMPKFCRAIIDLQYKHFLFELMFSLVGARENFSFRSA